MTDPIKQLQAAARAAARHVNPDGRAKKVVVFDASGEKLLDIQVPAGPVEVAEPAAAASRPGWDVDDRRAAFDGSAVKVSGSRLRLLRVLAEAGGPLTAKELTAAAFDRATDVANTRYHIRELRRELAEAFPTFEGSAVQGDDDGYRLLLR